MSLAGVVTGHENVAISNLVLIFDNANAGNNKTVSIISAQLTGTDAYKYTLSLTGSPTTTADITTKELTVSNAVASNKVYDGNTNAEITGSALVGVVSGDEVAINAQTGSFDDKNIGTGKPVTAALTINGADATNYSLTQPTGLAADITIKELTVSSAVASNKVYDGNTNAEITGSALVGVVSGDVVAINTQTGSFDDKNMGTGKPVTAALTINGADAANYSLTQPTGLTADIATKELTVSNAIASDKIYDGNTNAVITGSALVGVVSGDVVAINAQTGSFDDKNIGTIKPVTARL